MAKIIKEQIVLNVPAKKIYEALMDEGKHAEFTGAGAKIDNRIGGKFSVWDGYITGENKELIPGKKIVQSWHASDWPKNHISLVTFKFEQKDDQTILDFMHENVPNEFLDDIQKGWRDYYWQPLKEYFSVKNNS